MKETVVQQNTTSIYTYAFHRLKTISLSLQYLPEHCKIDRLSNAATFYRKGVFSCNMLLYICVIETNTDGVVIIKNLQKQNIMKKFGITLLAALLIGIFSAQAAGKVVTENKTKTTLDTSTEFETITIATKVPSGLKKAVTNQLLYPTDAQHKNIEGIVYMRLTIDENNNIKIIGLNATTPLLGKYVKEQLASTYVKKPGCEAGQVYRMKINFDLINE